MTLGRRLVRPARRCKPVVIVLALAVSIAFAPVARAQETAPDNPPLALKPGASQSGVGAPQNLAPRLESVLSLVATLAEESEPITFGLIWRIYSTTPNENGQYPLISKTEEAQPDIRLPAGSYIVHAAYGRAQATANITLEGKAVTETVNLNAGGLRIWADLGRGARNTVSNVTFKVYSSEQDDYGDRKLITETIDVGKLIRLTKGTYHVVSQFGAANAIIRSDVKVEAGKITDATIMHRAATVTLKLVNETGGEALANTLWSVLTPGGDTVTETIGAFPTYVLAEGEYEAVARHDERVYNKTFNVEAGIDREVELVAQ